MGHIGGRQVLSPLRHPLLPMLLPNNYFNENSNSYVKKKKTHIYHFRIPGSITVVNSFDKEFISMSILTQHKL